ncbi:hypothetical protein A7982_12238 [Minicystis rosea]|nr:hypothetical protein A7982_12238 [Minicystis rosea]
MSMRNDDESLADRGLVPRDLAGGSAEAALTSESIQNVRDFTARKTLEQAHALVTGLRRALAEGGEEGAILRDLERAGVGPRDADRIVEAAVALMDLLADRDRKADIFHAAVKEAGQAERAMYEQLASLSRTLGEQGLRDLGVPPSIGEANKAHPRPSSRPIFSAADVK